MAAGTPLELGDKVLQPVFNLASSVGNVFGNFFDFILLNILTPILLIAFIIVFFWAQIKLIKLYVSIVSSTFTFLQKAITRVSKNDKVKEILEPLNILPTDDN